MPLFCGGGVDAVRAIGRAHAPTIAAPPVRCLVPARRRIFPLGFGRKPILLSGALHDSHARKSLVSLRPADIDDEEAGAA